jgi:hypothetical protein
MIVKRWSNRIGQLCRSNAIVRVSCGESTVG